MGSEKVRGERRLFLDYELGAAYWWASWIGNPWLQGKIASYFAWKVNRKYAAYQRMLQIRARFKWFAAREAELKEE